MSDAPEYGFFDEEQSKNGPRQLNARNNSLSMPAESNVDDVDYIMTDGCVV